MEACQASQSPQTDRKIASKSWLCAPVHCISLAHRLCTRLTSHKNAPPYLGSCQLGGSRRPPLVWLAVTDCACTEEDSATWCATPPLPFTSGCEAGCTSKWIALPMLMRFSEPHCLCRPCCCCCCCCCCRCGGGEPSACGDDRCMLRLPLGASLSGLFMFCCKLPAFPYECWGACTYVQDRGDVHSPATRGLAW
eukprot:501422-Pelagomonas_calceolata.AAC.1